MRQIQEKLEFLDKEIVSLQCDLDTYTNPLKLARTETKIEILQEIERDLQVLAKFCGYYLAGSYDDAKNILMFLPTDTTEVQEIESYVSEMTNDYFDSTKKYTAENK